MGNTYVNDQSQKRRLVPRTAGLRPLQDTRSPDFVEECRRQSRIVAQADLNDTAMEQFMNAALADVDDWTE